MNFRTTVTLLLLSFVTTYAEEETEYLTVSEVFDIVELDLTEAWGPLSLSARDSWSEDEIPQLLELMTDGSDDVRWAASYALRLVKKIEEHQEQLHQVCLKMRQDPDERVRASCLILLSLYRLEEEEKLLEWLTADESDLVRGEEFLVRYGFSPLNPFFDDEVPEYHDNELAPPPPPEQPPFEFQEEKTHNQSGEVTADAAPPL